MKTEAPRNNLPPGEQGRAKETGNASPQDTSGTAPEIPADAIIIIPVRNTVLFPGTVLPLSVGRERSVAAAQDAARNERPVGILLQRNAEVADPGPSDLHEMGTVAGILRYVTGDKEIATLLRDLVGGDYSTLLLMAASDMVFRTTLWPPVPKVSR